MLKKKIMIRTHAIGGASLVEQRAAGLDYVTVGAVSPERRVEDLARMLGWEPGIALGAGAAFALNADALLAAVDAAIALPSSPKAVLLGPVSFLRLVPVEPGVDRLALLDRLLPVYEGLLVRLAARGVTWIQLDEPILGEPLPHDWQAALRKTYARLAQVDPQLLLAADASPLGPNLPLACELPAGGLHVDALRAPEELREIARRLPRDRELSAGVVDAAVIRPDDLPAALAAVGDVREMRGGRLWLAAQGRRA